MWSIATIVAVSVVSLNVLIAVFLTGVHYGKIVKKAEAVLVTDAEKMAKDVSQAVTGNSPAPPAPPSPPPAA